MKMTEGLETCKGRVGLLLQDYAALRDSDKLLWLAYLNQYHSLRKLLGPEAYKTLSSKDMSWHLNSGYARSTKKYGSQYMHRLISGATDKQVVDHANGNILDNRKLNLRITDQSFNSFNSKVHKDNKSGLKGVTFKNDQPREKPWMARIMIRGKVINLGNYKTKEDASAAYNKAAKEMHGEFYSYDLTNRATLSTFC